MRGKRLVGLLAGATAVAALGVAVLRVGHQDGRAPSAAVTPAPTSGASPCTPPPAARVAKRTAVLVALAARGRIDDAPDEPRSKRLHARLSTWLDRAAATAELAPQERRVTSAPLGSLSADERMRLSWEVESAAVLAWALGKHDLGPLDEPVEPRALAHEIGLHHGDAAALVEKAALRPVAELARLRDAMSTAALHVSDRKTPWRDLDLARLAQEPAFGPLDPRRVPVQGDLAAGGIALAHLDEGSVRALSHTVEMRRRASAWLCGDADDLPR